MDGISLLYLFFKGKLNVAHVGGHFQGVGAAGHLVGQVGAAHVRVHGDLVLLLRPAMVPVTLPESALSVMSGLAKASRSMLPMFTVQAARRRLFLKSMAKQLPKQFHFFSVKAIIPLEAH